MSSSSESESILMLLIWVGSCNHSTYCIGTGPCGKLEPFAKRTQRAARRFTASPVLFCDGNGDQKDEARRGCPKDAEIIEERLGTLPPAKAKVMLKDIHKLAVKSSRPADSRNASKTS